METKDKIIPFTKNRQSQSRTLFDYRIFIMSSAKLICLLYNGNEEKY